MLTYYVTITLVFFISYYAQSRRWVIIGDEMVESKKYNVFVFFTALILIAVSGLRFGVGTDFFGYALHYRISWQELWNNIITFHEPGTDIIAYFSQYLYNDSVTFIFLTALVTVFLNVNTIRKYSDDFCLGVLLYIFIGAWHGSFNAIRQYLAAGVLFYGHRMILERKFWKWTIIVFIAMLFHRTALVMLPIYFIANSRDRRIGILMLLIMVGAMFMSGDFLFSIMGELKGADQTQYAYMQQSVNSIRILVSFAPIVLLPFMPRKAKNDRETGFYLMMLASNAGFMFATASSAYLARVGIYTDIYATIAFPRIINAISKDGRSANIFRIFIILLYFGFWFYEVYSRDTLRNFYWVFERARFGW